MSEVGFEPKTHRLQCTGQSGEQWLVLVSSWLELPSNELQKVILIGDSPPQSAYFMYHMHFNQITNYSVMQYLNRF